MMKDLFVIVAVILFTMMAALFTYVGVMISGDDKDSKKTRVVCILLGVVFLVITVLSKPL